MPIDTNGKKFFNRALPPNTGSHVLALRERHTEKEYLHYLTDNLPELQQRHHVKTIGIESAPYLMLFEWAYRDGKLAETEALAAEKLKNIRTALIYEEFERDEFIDFLQQARQQGMDIIHFDARKKNSFKDALNQYEQPLKIINLHRKKGELLQFDGYQDGLEVLHEAQQLYLVNPEYRARLDAIERTIEQMHAKEIPTDIISATIAATLADRNSNMMTISGAAHLSSFTPFNNVVGKAPQSEDLQGLFDEGLVAARWNVTDAHLTSSSEQAFALDSLRTACKNYDNADVVYIADQDKILTRQSLKSNGYRFESPIPCPDKNSELSYLNPAKIFTPTQLNPSSITELNVALEDLRKALAPDDTSSPSIPSRPKHQRRATGQTP